RVYSRALSAQEIADQYRQGARKFNVDLQKGLVGHWELSEESYNPATKRLTDNSAYENHGTSGNAGSFATDRMGQSDEAMSFNGTNDYVDCGNDASLSQTSIISMFGWVNGGGNQVAKTFIGQWDIGINQRSFSIRTQSDKLEVLLSDDGAYNSEHKKLYRSSIVVFDDLWHYVGFTFNAGTLKLYVDGVEDTNPTKIYDDAITTLHDSTADLNIGCALNNNVPTNYFNGSMSDVRIYNRALSEGEVGRLYESYGSKFMRN
ncbi:MAG: LamG domain-containing protein, partial [Patescibacteria group bacterium]|nr:LamG domain-containing protein [Patescibacteria group bacterium]